MIRYVYLIIQWDVCSCILFVYFTKSRVQDDKDNLKLSSLCVSVVDQHDRYLLLFEVITKMPIHTDMSIQNTNILIQHIVLNWDFLQCLTPSAISFFFWRSRFKKTFNHRLIILSLRKTSSVWNLGFFFLFLLRSSVYFSSL